MVGKNIKVSFVALVVFALLMFWAITTSNENVESAENNTNFAISIEAEQEN